MNIALTILVGVFLAINGVGYKVGSIGKIPSIQSGLAMNMIGLAAFGLLGHAEWQYLDWSIIAAGAVFGLTTYIGIRLLKIALQIGPLSPAWCAVSLTFVPVICYAAIGLHEPMSGWQIGALCFTIGSIVAASCGASGGAKASSLQAKLLYGCLLIGILLSISVLNVGLKFCSIHYMSNGRSMTGNCGNLLIFFTYVFMAATSTLDLSLSHTWKFNRYFWWSGLMLGASSIGAYMIILYVIDKISAVVLFALSNAISILGSALMDAFIMKEKRTLSWYLTVIFAILAILFNR